MIKGKKIPILSYSIGASNPATIAVAGGGAGAGKATFSSLTMMKGVDAASTALFKALATGEHFKEATLTAHWGSGATAATMTYKLESVVVESIQQSGSSGTPTESLSLAFRQDDMEVHGSVQHHQRKLGSNRQHAITRSDPGDGETADFY